MCVCVYVGGGGECCVTVLVTLTSRTNHPSSVYAQDTVECEHTYFAWTCHKHTHPHARARARETGFQDSEARLAALSLLLHQGAQIQLWLLGTAQEYKLLGGGRGCAEQDRQKIAQFQKHSLREWTKPLITEVKNTRMKYITRNWKISNCCQLYFHAGNRSPRHKLHLGGQTNRQNVNISGWGGGGASNGTQKRGTEISHRN